MPRPKLNVQETKRKRQERNQRYRENIPAKERNKEYDRIYRQRKREQARLHQHQDPLAQLADIVTQQQYLDEANARDNSLGEIESIMEEEEEAIDVAGMVEEDGEVLENFYDGGFGGSDDGGFMNNDEIDSDGN